MRSAVLVVAMLIAVVVRAAEHKFVDAANVALWSANAAVQVIDYRVTQSKLARGYVELNPLGQSRGERIALKATAAVAPIPFSWLAHKTGHHRIERLIPALSLVPAGVGIAVSKRF